MTVMMNPVHECLEGRSASENHHQIEHSNVEQFCSHVLDVSFEAPWFCSQSCILQKWRQRLKQNQNLEVETESSVEKLFGWLVQFQNYGQVEIRQLAVQPKMLGTNLEPLPVLIRSVS